MTDPFEPLRDIIGKIPSMDAAGRCGCAMLARMVAVVAEPGWRTGGIDVLVRDREEAERVAAGLDRKRFRAVLRNELAQIAGVARFPMDVPAVDDFEVSFEAVLGDLGWAVRCEAVRCAGTVPGAGKME